MFVDADGEGAVVVATALVDDFVAREAAGTVQDELLQATFGVGLQRVLVDDGDDGQDGASDEVAGNFWPLVDVDGPDDGFENVGAEGIAGAVVEGAQVGDVDADEGEKAQILPDASEDTATDHFRFERRHLTLRSVGEVAINVLHDLRADDRVTQEFQGVV